MIPKIKHLKAKKNFILEVEFDDGKRVNYNVEEDIETIPTFSPLRSEYRLFEHVCLDSSRTCVYWNDWIDLPSDVIYEDGKPI